MTANKPYKTKKVKTNRYQPDEHTVLAYTPWEEGAMRDGTSLSAMCESLTRTTLRPLSVLRKILEGWCRGRVSRLASSLVSGFSKSEISLIGTSEMPSSLSSGWTLTSSVRSTTHEKMGCNPYLYLQCHQHNLLKGEPNMTVANILKTSTSRIILSSAFSNRMLTDENALVHKSVLCRGRKGTRKLAESASNITFENAINPRHESTVALAQGLTKSECVGGNVSLSDGDVVVIIQPSASSRNDTSSWSNTLTSVSSK